jgi:hypothetical protein
LCSDQIQPDFRHNRVHPIWIGGTVAVRCTHAICNLIIE